MNLFLSLLLSVLSGHLSGVVKSDGLIAISTGSSVRALYKRITDAELVPDRAYSDANFRKSTCDEITSSGYFPTKGLRPVNMEPVALSTKLRDKKIFSRIYATVPAQRNDSSSAVSIMLSNFLSSNKQQPKFEYRNSFAPRKFVLRDFYGETIVRRVENVFVCLLEEEDAGKVYPYYVTKKYNVVGDPVRAGRFIFTERREGSTLYTRLFLAEAPAKVFEDPDNPKYDVELKYLERRQDLPLASEMRDPICSLLTGVETENYGERLCALVMSSSDFQRTKIQHVESWGLPRCHEITVSFNSAEATEIVGEKVYREQALRCDFRDPINGYLRDNNVYITRGYAPNEVFVFQYDIAKKKTFLKNLSIDVGLVRDGVTVQRVIRNQP